jgi:hypothetical protein
MKSCPKATVAVLSVCICVVVLSGLPVAGQTLDNGPWWPHPIWGPDDQAGASNWITPEKILEAISLVETGKVYELGHIYERSMVLLGQRTFAMFSVLDSEPSGKDQLLYNSEFLCAEIGQVGTQFDGPGHVGKRITMSDGSKADVFYNGVPAEEMQARYGLRRLGIENVKPIVTRGILGDVAGYKGVETLPNDYEVSLSDVRGALEKQSIPESQIRPGDALLFNYGWWRLWNDPERFRTSYTTWPGIGQEVAQWIIERKVSIVGSDISTDRFPTWTAHHELTLKHGIFNLEFMNFEELIGDGVHEFLFIFTPLRLKGATGSPGRPLAIR